MINILTTTPGVDEAAQIDSLALANEIAEKASAEATTSSMSIWDLCFGGGAFSVVLMCLLFALFFVMVFIFVDRFIAIRKATTIDSNFMNRIRDFISEGNIDNAQVFCTITARSFPYVGMITGSARTDSAKVTNCAVGGNWGVAYDEEQDVTIITKITSSNFYKYIYGKTTDWTGVENYDGNTLLSASPIAPANE